ncbi:MULTISPECIES: type II secretion system F family protein [unclassified Paenarthrobacter]|uniref:type II secretion system F family protein n=1 Tax=unclassified Paenarthrobacter TaxID=2634190 RepID=UPI003CF488BC
MMLFAGLALMLSAIVAFGIAVILPKTPEVPLERRRPYQLGSGSGLTKLTGSTTEALHGFLTRRNVRLFNRETLDHAGVRMSQADFVVLVIAGAFVGALIGLVAGGVLIAVLLGLAAPLIAHLVLKFRAGKRRSTFDDQLGDTLQLLSGGLRAGHSILRAIDAAAAESASPTAEEMRRIITETSLGRDVHASLSDTAERMRSEDFVWIAQAIQINREVGGNLAEVLDQVNETIRERSEIKGHIKSLAAEGKFSAYILMALPFGIVLLLMVVNPGYMNVMFTHPLGWGLIALSAILMTIGGLWMRKIIDLKF